jgi:hypothetical protein
MNTHKTFWTHIEPWLDRQQYAFTTFSVLAALFFFYHQLSRDTIKTDADLLKIDGIVMNYSFADKQNGRGILHQYYIWLDGYTNAFQIPADFLSHFEKNEFEAHVKKGDSLSVTIPRQKMAELNTSTDNIYLMSIDEGTYNYLDKAKTMKIENSGFDIYAGIFFLVIGVGFYLFKRW